MTQDNQRKDIHFTADRTFDDDSRYDPGEDPSDFDQFDQEMEETEEEFRSAEVEKKRRKKPAA